MKIPIRKLFSILIVTLSTLCSFAQDTTFHQTVPPFTGSKLFRKLSFGIHAGVLAPAVVSGGANDFTKPQYSLGYGANIRYQVSHLFGLELNGLRGHLEGNQDKALGNGLPANRPVTSFSTEIKALGTLNGVITLGNINWISVKNTIVPYLTMGGGLASYAVKIVPRGSSTEVDYKKGDIHEGVVNWGAGTKINLSSLLNLDLGYKAYYVDGDNLDGLRLTSRHYDKFGYGFVGLEFSLGDKNKPKLLFNNPAAALQSGVMSEINKLKAMIPSDVDTDKDGVPDRMDMEPSTPAGCPVDVRGVSIDTDGDGVPDCRDKEKITPTQCQPVDADGVGRCPEPECCKNLVAPQASCATSLGSLPAISFSGNSASLSTDAQGMLASVASRLRNSPNCRLTIVGYCVSPKATQARGVARVDAVANYFVEKEGISRDRLTTLYGQQGGDCATVDLRAE